MSREEQVTQLTDYMAKFIAHVAKKLPDDVIAKLQELREKEDSPLSKVIYDTMFRNQELAVALNRPSCQDTGVLQFWVKCGTKFPLIDLCFFFHMLSISFPETVYNLTYNLLCKLPEGIFTFSFYLRNSSNPVSLIWSTREPSPVLTIFPSTIT